MIKALMYDHVRVGPAESFLLVLATQESQQQMAGHAN
jgi:hypothetical protein